MSNEGEGSKAPKADDKKKAPDKTVEKAPNNLAEKPAVQVGGPPPPLDDRKLKYAELLPHAGAFATDELVAMLSDGRAIVRGNAALALAAGNHALPELVTLVRDSEISVALSVAEAFGKLGPLVRPLVPAIVAALDGAKPEVADAIVGTLAEQIGRSDDELIAALDVPFELAMKSVVEACKRAGKPGIAMLAKATHHERSRVRVNAAGGLGKLGKADPDTALAALHALEQGDPVPDIRTASKQAILAVVAREKVVAVDGLPKNIPDFEVRKLTLSELSEYADQIDIDQMLFALQDGRDHVRVNGARGLAAKGAKAAHTATSIGLLLRDSVAAVRREAAKAIGKLGPDALDAAPHLVSALGDVESDVIDAATDTLAAFGERVMDALVKGLDVGEDHGRRVAELIARSPRSVDLLHAAFGSPAVNVQVNAAAGLGMLGKDRVGKALAALHGARTGGDVRTRAAVRAALDIIEAKRDTGPQEVSVPGFEDRFLALADLEKAKGELEKIGVGDLTAHLTDGREIVRANAALALGVLGAASAGAAGSLGVLMRDDSMRVRLSAAQALDKIGDGSVIETADYLVGALRSPDDKVAETVAGVLRARKTRMISALVRGLETDDEVHATRIVALIHALPEALDLLCDAFESPAVNVQVNAALGLGTLGAERVGKGRRVLEGGRTGGDARRREAVRKALDLLDGPKQTGPGEITVDGFETQILEPAAFADASKLRLDDVAHYLNDGRPVVRANAATAMGAIGAPALGMLHALGVLCRDDDMRVRIAAAGAIDKLGDDAVREVAGFLVGALRGDAEVAKAMAKVLAARKARVLGALLKGLETDDATQARRILELIVALPDASEILCDAFDSPAENVQVNAAIGIGMLGEKRAGTAGRKKLEGARTGGFASTREAVFKALAALKNS